MAGLVSRRRRPPHLTAVIVGDDKASQIYVGNKMKAAEKCGLKATVLKKDSSLQQTQLLEILDQLGRDDQVHPHTGGMLAGGTFMMQLLAPFCKACSIQNTAFVQSRCILNTQQWSISITHCSYKFVVVTKTAPLSTVTMASLSPSRWTVFWFNCLFQLTFMRRPSVMLSLLIRMWMPFILTTLVRTSLLWCIQNYSLQNPLGHFCSGEPRFVPATPLGVLEIIKRLRVPTFGKNVCIANRSKNIGQYHLPTP